MKYSILLQVHNELVEQFHFIKEWTVLDNNDLNKLIVAIQNIESVLKDMGIQYNKFKF